jgi:hypothetical protein
MQILAALPDVRGYFGASVCCQLIGFQSTLIGL